MKIKHIVSLSGGKDSTALLLLALEWQQKKGIDFDFVFADTGNEVQILYDYLDYLDAALNIKIKKVKPNFDDEIKHKRHIVDTKWRKEGIPEWKIKEALGELYPTGNPFLDLCIYKGRFPSSKAQFCTEELKANAISKHIYMPYLKDDFKICSWQGVRKEESLRRSKLSTLQQTDLGVWAFRPIIDWKWQDVFDMHRKHNIYPNPLYKKGFTRVGCMPCINCRKSELHLISKVYPQEIKRIAEWEKIVSRASKCGAASFFYSGSNLQEPDIYTKVEWSKTSHGGKQYNMHDMMEESTPSCSSAYGLCE